MILNYITCKDKKEAKNIANHLMKKKLIACANIFPIESLYKWKEKLENNKEIVLLAKTTNKKSNTVEKEVKKIHSYDIPCIIKINATANKDYEKWLNAQIK